MSFEPTIVSLTGFPQCYQPLQMHIINLTMLKEQVAMTEKVSVKNEHSVSKKTQCDCAMFISIFPEGVQAKCLTCV